MLDAKPLFALYARWRVRQLLSLDPVATQERELAGLVRRAGATRFGRDHDFDRIKTVEDFQKAVPLRRFETFWQEYWQPDFPVLRDVTWPGLVPYFPSSSGTTTGASKYLPCTQDMVRSNKKAALDTLVWHLHNHPDARPFSGKTFMLGGSTNLKQEAPGVKSGDLSGIAAHTTPLWARLYLFPPEQLALIENWDEKLETLARHAVKERFAVLSGAPSWLLILLTRMAELKGGNPADAMPDLDLLIHGGMAWPSYVPLFEPFLAPSGAKTREVYPASEGFIAIQDRGSGEGMRLNLDIGIFYEFVPVEEIDSENPTRHWVKTIEPDVNYAVVLSCCSGLFGYVIGDTVRFVERNPPRLLITGRTSYMLSAFGEHLIGEEIEAAMRAAVEANDVAVREFTVGPVFPNGDTPLGHHIYVVELHDGAAKDGDLPAKLARAIDDDLKVRNDDYRMHRGGDAGMAPPRVRLVPPGTFADWMRAQGRLGGQNKVPRVLANPDRFNEFLAWLDAR
jgi:hypothetical protein